MSNLVLIPGAVSARTARFLALAPAGQNPPTFSISPAGANLNHLPRPPVAASISAGLAARGVSLWPIEYSGLEPGARYRVTVDAAGRSAQALTSTLPRRLPPEGLSVVVASCYYDFFKGHARYRAALAASTPFPPHRFKLLIGDNLYLDVEPAKSSALDAVEDTLRLYTTYFVVSEYRQVLSYSPNFTTWDDHEFWNNFPEWQLQLRRTYGAELGFYRNAATECLKLFQECLNPARSFPGSGRSYSFAVLDPDRPAPNRALSFFMADVRTNRDPYAGPDTHMMTGDDVDELVRWAAGLDCPGVLVLGQPLVTRRGGRTDYNPPDFSRQYREIWKAVIEAPWDILVVSGDIHDSRLLAIEIPAGVVPGQRATTLYEFVSSPASHIPTFGWSLLHTLGVADPGKQASGSASYPESVEIGHVRLPRIAPRYLIGTDVPETIGLLNFRPAQDGSVRVECAFWDSRGGVAPALPTNGGTRRPVSSICFLPNTIRLGKRR